MLKLGIHETVQHPGRFSHAFSLGLSNIRFCEPIIFSRLMKILPQGAIQFAVNSDHPKMLEHTAQIMPSTRPMIIFQCRASFFIGGNSLSYRLSVYFVIQYHIDNNHGSHGFNNRNSSWQHAGIMTPLGGGYQFFTSPIYSMLLF